MRILGQKLSKNRHLVVTSTGTSHHLRISMSFTLHSKANNSNSLTLKTQKSRNTTGLILIFTRLNNASNKKNTKKKDLNLNMNKLNQINTLVNLNMRTVNTNKECAMIRRTNTLSKSVKSGQKRIETIQMKTTGKLLNAKDTH